MKSFALLLFVAFSVIAFEPSEKYERNLLLNAGRDSNGNYKLYWKVINDEILFEAHVGTLGWIGLGFGPQGVMNGSDIVIGGVKDGSLYIYDLHAIGNSMPIMDTEQSYEILSGSVNDTHTVIKFKRKLNTCDENDWPITDDTTKLIWAYSDEDVQNESEIQKHINKGSKNVMLLQPSQSKDVPFDFTINITLQNMSIPGNQDTFYACKIFRLPDLPKAHVVKYQPAIQAGHEDLIYSIVLSHCISNMSEYEDRQEACFSRDYLNKSELYQCSSTFFVSWGLGDEGLVFPSEAALPIFEPGSSPYVLLEINFKNENFISDIVDNSGLLLYISSALRPFDMGSFQMTLRVDPEALILPPGQKLITYSMHCDFHCTKDIPSEGVNITNAWLHQHTHGKGIRVRHVRKGVELSPIFEDDFYDYKFQTQYVLATPRLLLPDDTLIMECQYSTLNEKNVTVGGYGVKDEMCVTFLNYYPKTKKLIYCEGGPVAESIANAMGAQYHSKNGITYVQGSAGTLSSLKEYAAKYWKTGVVGSEDNARTEAGELYQSKIDSGWYYQLWFEEAYETTVLTTDQMPGIFSEYKVELRMNFFPKQLLPRPYIPYEKINITSCDYTLLTQNSFRRK